MTNYDPGGPALLERLASESDPAMFRQVPDAEGTDRNETLKITLDAARRVVDIRVLDVDRLRRPDPFIDAVREAFAIADGARAYASLVMSGQAEEYLARAEAALSGQRPLRAPAPPDVSREACARRREERGAAPDQRPSPAPVTSDNGYLTMQRGRDGRLIGVSVDAEWLSAARPEQLERALRQASLFGTEH